MNFPLNDDSHMPSNGQVSLVNTQTHKFKNESVSFPLSGYSDTFYPLPFPDEDGLISKSDLFALKTDHSLLSRF